MTPTPTLSPELTRYGITFHTLEHDDTRRFPKAVRL
jgi:hypothetical protein